MKEKYWAMYEQIKFSERYFWYYNTLSVRISTVIKIFLLSASLAGVAGLWFWNKIPHAWPTIAAIAQILSAVAYLLPLQEQIDRSQIMWSELSLLLNRIDRDWSNVDDMNDDEINSLVFKYQNQFALMEQKNIGSTYFPERKCCREKAREACKDYKYQRFGITETNHLEEVKING